MFVIQSLLHMCRPTFIRRHGADYPASAMRGNRKGRGHQGQRRDEMSARSPLLSSVSSLFFYARACYLALADAFDVRPPGRPLVIRGDACSIGPETRQTTTGTIFLLQLGISRQGVCEGWISGACICAHFSVLAPCSGSPTSLRILFVADG